MAAQRNARWFAGLGGAMLIGGGVLYFLGSRKASESGTVSLVPSHDGATVVWGSQF
jgi:hypothetical protein